VGEPSVEATIAILRGLKERYEVHHGCASKTAPGRRAVLSNRYITGRFLPDKAIDLMDEAASRLRIEIDSMPPRSTWWSGASANLRSSGWPWPKRPTLRQRAAGQDRRRAGQPARDLRRHESPLHNEKEAIDTIRSFKGRLEALRARPSVTSATATWPRREIRYGDLPNIQVQVDEASKHLAELQHDQKMLKEESTRRTSPR